MNWLEFIASVVDSLAWPTGIVAAAYLLRKHVAMLLKGRVLKRVKAAGVEAEFDERLQEAEEKADKVGGLPREDDPAVERVELLPPAARSSGDDLSDPDPSDGIGYLARRSPEAAVLAAWSEIDRELRATAQRLNMSDTGPGRRIVAALRRSGALSPENAAIVDDLAELRNQVAHPIDARRTLYAVDAQEYARLAKRLIAALRSIETPRHNPLVG